MQMNTAIIGGGPIGLYTAFRLGLNGIESKIFETLDSVGGQCLNLYKDKEIYDLPGISSITAGNLITKLLSQVTAVGKTEIALSSMVRDIKQDSSSFLLFTDKGEERFDNVVITTGGGAFEPRKLSIEGIDNTADFIKYSVKEKRLFCGKRVIILGGGDSALDWAIELQDISKSVTLIHRSASFRASALLVNKITCSKCIQTLLNTQTLRLEKRENSVTLYVKDNEVEKQLDADFIIVCFGMISASNMFENWSIKLDIKNNKILVDPVSAETSIPGLFAAGDISYYQSKKANLLSGFFQALQISNHINSRIYTK